MPEFSVRILWGQAPDPEDKPHTYTFSSQELLDAFMEGVEAASGWLEYEIVENEYSHEPDDGHEHQFSAEDGLPDTGTDASATICTLCGMLSTEEDGNG